jgi:Restriction endonuclease
MSTRNPSLSCWTKLGLWFENENHYTMSLYPTDDKVREDYLSLYRWQWLKHLAEKKVYELHGEIFEYFGKYPADLQRLHWREFEELLDSIFRNQGYYTELGPGRNDGGVDIRLYQHKGIPEVVTLVQAKRYKDPIGLQPITSIFGLAAMERAKNAMLATTSYFEPKARQWALSTEQNIDLPQVELADASRIGGWCAEIGKNLNDYFTKGLSVPPALKDKTGPLAGKVVVAQGSYNCTNNFLRWWRLIFLTKPFSDR